MKKLWIWGLSVLIAFSLMACYPEGAEYVDEMDIAMTHYDESVNFSDFKTFVMPDTIVYVGSGDESKSVERSADSVILDLVVKNFENRHFVRLTEEEVQNEEKPDFVVTVSAFSNAYFYYGRGYSWYDYWGWYPGWNWFNMIGSWSSFYPWYPWYAGGVYYAYNTGTLTIEMMNPNGVEEGSKQIPVLWNGVVNGILAGHPAYLQNRLEANINQCFIQSPYLKTTK